MDNSKLYSNNNFTDFQQKKEEKCQIRVCIRCKPLSNRERNVIQIIRSANDDAGKSEPASIVIGEKHFNFDSIFDSSASQGDVYQNCVKPLVDGCFQGYNATIFACEFWNRINTFIILNIMS